MKKRPIIFDCDPGHDDAIALVMALACPDWDIRAITTVGGNNTIQNVTNNALRILEVTGRTEIPVASRTSRSFPAGVGSNRQISWPHRYGWAFAARPNHYTGQ